MRRSSNFRICTAYLVKRIKETRVLKPVADIPESVYYYGHWINEGWLNEYKDIILPELSFKPIGDERNKRYEAAICNSYSVGLHIRRGDYVAINCEVSVKAVRQHINICKEHIPHPLSYFVFSDDIGWCRENAQAMGLPEDAVTYIEGNMDYENNYIDLQLMTMCRIIIGGSSAFSYIACLLNRTKNFFAAHAMFERSGKELPPQIGRLDEFPLVINRNKSI